MKCSHLTISSQLSLSSLILFTHPQEYFYEAYLLNTDIDNLKDKRLSPLHANVADFPPNVCFIACDLEPNKADIASLFDKLLSPEYKGRFEGVYLGHGIPHGFNLIPEFVLKKLGKSKAEGGQGNGVELKNEMYELTANFIEKCVSK